MPTQQLIPLIVVVVMLPLILLRNRRPRVLRPQWLWVMPVFIVAMLGFGIWGSAQAPGVSHAPFQPIDWTILAVGALLGALAGWQRGRMTTIEKHPDGELRAQASPLGLILIVAILVGRRALEAWLRPHADALGLNSLAVTDVFLVFVGAMIVLQRVEMFIRARRIQSGGTDAHVQAAA